MYVTLRGVKRALRTWQSVHILDLIHTAISVLTLRGQASDILKPGTLTPDGLIVPLGQEYEVVHKPTFDNALQILREDAVIFQVGIDYHKMIAAIDLLMFRTSDCLLYTGTGERLANHVRLYKVHDSLLGRLEDLFTICEKARNLGIELLPSNTIWDEFAQAVRTFANLCQLIEDGESNGKELQEHIKGKSETHVQKLIEALSNVDRGGRTYGMSEDRLYIVEAILKIKADKGLSLEGAANSLRGILMEKHKRGELIDIERRAYNLIIKPPDLKKYIDNLYARYKKQTEDSKLKPS